MKLISIGKIKVNINQIKLKNMIKILSKIVIKKQL